MTILKLSINEVALKIRYFVYIMKNFTTWKFKIFEVFLLFFWGSMSLIKFSNLLSLTVEESLFIPELYIKSLNFFVF